MADEAGQQHDGQHVGQRLHRLHGNGADAGQFGAEVVRQLDVPTTVVPGAPVAAALAALCEARLPDVILFSSSYD
jgi:hypothetical protein